MPILGSFNSAANRYMSKILTDGDIIVKKEEIARYEQFLLFPQCFQKLPSVDVLK